MACSVNAKNIILLLSILVILGIILYLSKSKDFTNKNQESFISSVGISTKEELYDLLTTDDVAIVRFHVDYCGWCKKLAPTWQKFENEYNNKIIKGKKIMVLSVDCEKTPKMSQLFQIKGYPTILIIKKNKTIEYNGERTLHALQNIVNNL